MPIYLNKQDKIKLQSKVRSKLMTPILPPKKVQQEFSKKATELWTRVLFPATERIKQMIKDEASLYLIAEEIERTLRWATNEYATYSKHLVDRWRASVDEHTRGQMNAALRRAIGLDMTAVFEAPEVKEALAIGGMEAANLIKSIPGQHLGKIAQAVADNFSGRRLPENRSLLQQIQEIGKVSKKRAKLIARDQTSKLTGMLNEVRQTAIGIDEYIWRTSGDERVVGNPMGLYPEGNKTHGDHYHRNGKKFRWDSPPQDGHPGSAIQCRCYAQPIIDPQKIIALAREQ